MTPTIINEPFKGTVTCAETAHKQVHAYTHTHTHTHTLRDTNTWIRLRLFTKGFGNDGRLNVADAIL